MKIDLDHYHFTDFKKERVTLGFKTPLTRMIPFVLNLFPTEIQRYLKNTKVHERFFPHHWWVRSDSPK